MNNHTTTVDRKAVWTPPPRPDWVAKVNGEGRHLDIEGIVPLDAESLIKTAVANTGLSDFGSADWREPFELYCQGLAKDAQLTLMGRIMTRSDLLMLLEGRLRIEQAYNLHPEIEDEKIEAPILIVGQGRTGTSAMVNILAEDPDNAVTRTWHTLFPGLPPDRETEERWFNLADQRMRMWSRVTPELEAIHEFTAEVPTESIHVESLSFQSPAWQAIFGQTTAVFKYMFQHGYVDAVKYEKRLLKLLQWRFGKTRWVMKSPDSLNYIPDVLKVYPDLQLVWMHRDPIKALSSAVNMVGTFTWARSDMSIAPGSWDTVADPAVCARMLTRPIEWIEAGVIRKDQLLSIQYLDFIADPLHEVQRIYAFAGRELTQAGRSAMGSYLARSPRSNRPAHKYDTGDLTEVSRERQAFGRYQAYFNVANEG